MRGSIGPFVRPLSARLMQALPDWAFHEVSALLGRTHRAGQACPNSNPATVMSAITGRWAYTAGLPTVVDMRYDNDVNGMRRDIRSQSLNFVRAHFTNPRRAAALGLAAAIGTGALLLTGGPHSAAATPTTAKAAAVTHAVSDRAASTTTARAHDRVAAKPVTAAKTTAKPATAAKTAKTAKEARKAAAAAKTKAMLRTAPVAGLDRTQMKNAALIVRAGQDLGISQRGQIVAVATAMQESNLYNRASHVVPESLKYDHQGLGADYDSVGLFQQRYTTGWGTVKSIMNPTQSATKFYKALRQVDGWQNMPITVAAQTVQGSAFPDAYAKHQGNAAAVVKAVNQAAKR